jgi:hypothetical protein
MPNFEVDFSYKVEEYGTVTVEADDRDQAEDFAREYFIESFANVPVSDMIIEDIKVIER